MQSHPWWSAVLLGCNPLATVGMEGRVADRSPIERATSAHVGHLHTTGDLRWSRSGWLPSDDMPSVEAMFESSSSEEEVLAWEAAKVDKVRGRRLRRRLRRRRSLPPSHLPPQHPDGRSGVTSSDSDVDAAEASSDLRGGGEYKSESDSAADSHWASDASSCDTVAEKLLDAGRRVSKLPDVRGGLPMQASSGLAHDEERDIAYGSDEDVEMEGDVDCLSRDKLHVFYPSDVQWSTVYGSWLAAPLPAITTRHSSLFPYSHPYYAREAVYSPDDHVPSVVSRVIVLPPRSEACFSFRFRYVMERLIEDHEATIRERFVTSFRVHTPPPIRWSVVLRDMALLGNFPKQFAQALVDMPQLRSLAFCNSRTCATRTR